VRLIDQLRQTLTAEVASRAAAMERLNAAIAPAEGESRDLNEDEARAFSEARDEVRAIDGRMDELQARIAELEDIDQRNDARRALAAELEPTPPAEPRTEVPGRAEPPVRVRSEPLTYSEESARRGVSIIRDAWLAHQGLARGAALERLQRHDAEVRAGAHGEQRAVDTGDLPGHVIPQYLTELNAEILRAGRVTANLCRPLELPAEGMTLNIPRATQGTLVEQQTSQNTALSERDYTDTNLPVAVRTYGGQVNVSRQSIERGRDTDTLIMDDMMAEYATKLNNGVINGPGTNGTHTGIRFWGGTSAITVGGPASASNIIAYIGRGIATVNAGRFIPPDVIVMAPRRWGWLSTAGDGDGRSLVVVGGIAPVNAFGQGDADRYGFVGSILGVPTYTDGTIPLTLSTQASSTSDEDTIIVARRADLLLWENGPAPRQFRFEETLGGNLTVKLVAADDSAFTAGRHPEGVAILEGTALANPYT
jgi:HK97 family phage major capsid protein